MKDKFLFDIEKLCKLEFTGEIKYDYKICLKRRC